MEPDAERSYARVEMCDLDRLGRLAHQDREHFFRRRPRWATLYADRVICVALCQGAAIHFVNGENGVKDFDVWTFFADRPEARFPWRRPVTSADFGPSKFGRNPMEPPRHIGRRVDFMMRGLDEPPDADPVEAIRRYLTRRATDSAAALAEKAVVLIEPARLRGVVAWPHSTGSAGRTG